MSQGAGEPANTNVAPPHAPTSPCIVTTFLCLPLERGTDNRRLTLSSGDPSQKVVAFLAPKAWAVALSPDSGRASAHGSGLSHGSWLTADSGPAATNTTTVDRMKRVVASVLSSVLVLSACGGGSTLTEYAAELESAVAQMNGRLDELDASLGGAADLDEVRRYANERVAARYAFVETLKTLEPPSEVDELHDTALDVMGRLADAESALADYVNEVDDAATVDDFWATPLGVAARTADEESISLCLAAEERLDTRERSELAELPWIPPELKEVVVVAFGCIAGER